MNGNLKHTLVVLGEFIVLPVIAILLLLEYTGIFSLIPTATGLAAGNGGARFAGFFGNQTVTITVQTEPTASHGTGKILGVKVNGWGTGSINSGNWPSGVSSGTQDLTITGDQNGATARCRTSFSGS